MDKTALDKVPRVRFLTPTLFEVENQQVVMLRDPLHFSPDNLSVPIAVFLLMSLMNGERDVPEIQEEYKRQFGGKVAVSDIEGLVLELDQHGLLESDRFLEMRANILHEFHYASVRPATHAGTAYEADPVALRKQIDGFYEAAEIESLPMVSDSAVKGIIAPHIDPRVGGPCAAKAFAALRDMKEPPELFVIFGTAHQPGNSLFILTEKTFETPMGKVEVDHEAARALAAGCPFDLTVDEYLHKHEHSIEFMIIFLQHLYAGRHDFKILPILVGSFFEFIDSNMIPSAAEPVMFFNSALRHALLNSGKRVCFIAGADLSHMGKKFGDEDDLTEEYVNGTREFDAALLEHVAQARQEDFFRELQIDADKQKVCGLPPIYTMMNALGEGVEGRLVGYDVNVEEATESFVSFASVVFTKKE